MTTTQLSPKLLDEVLERIAAAADAGERCPTNDQLPGGSIPQLARRGSILVEVYIHNFRRVTILTGPHAGKSTLAPPLRGGVAPKPYLTVSARGTYRNGRQVTDASEVRTRVAPSAPRDLSGGA